MDERIFGEREKAMEGHYFRQHDAHLLDTLRRNAKIDHIARAVAEKLQVDNTDLLLRARALGITPETASAFLLSPLVQVAWAGGTPMKPERRAVLRLARARGVEPGSPASSQLETWLRERPSDELFRTAMEVLAYSLGVLPPDERHDRIEKMLDACHEVAKASGSGFSWLLFFKDRIAEPEAATLEAISRALHRLE